MVKTCLVQAELNTKRIHCISGESVDLIESYVLASALQILVPVVLVGCVGFKRSFLQRAHTRHRSTSAHSTEASGSRNGRTWASLGVLGFSLAACHACTIETQSKPLKTMVILVLRAFVMLAVIHEVAIGSSVHKLGLR